MAENTKASGTGATTGFTSSATRPKRSTAVVLSPSTPDAKDEVMKLVVFAIACALIAGPSSARSVESLEKTLAVKKEVFSRRRAAAEETVLRHFEMAIRKVTRSKRIPVTDRVSLAKVLTAQKEQFLRSGVWPDDGNFAEWAYTYAKRVQSAYKSVGKAYDQLISSHLNSDDMAQAERLTTEKIRFESKALPGRGRFSSGSKWHGARSSQNHHTKILFNVRAMTGSIFQATVHQNPKVAGHTEFQVEGSIDGMHIYGRSTKVIHGHSRSLAFDGFILGNHVVLRVAGIGAKGRRIAAEAIVLQRVN